MSKNYEYYGDGRLKYTEDELNPYSTACRDTTIREELRKEKPERRHEAGR